MNKIIGNVDSITASSITGWCIDLGALDYSPIIRVRIHDAVVCEARANAERPDVQARHKLTHGYYGFNFTFTLPPDRLTEVVVDAIGRDGQSTPLIVPSLDKKVRSVPHYQSFNDEEGHSASMKKLAALKLEQLEPLKAAPSSPPLRGKSVLDIGCNEGFFCKQAIAQGASRVVGCDADLRYLSLARQRCPEAEFIHSTWWDLPDERFDVIFFLSAFHYEEKPRELLIHLKKHLAPSGVLVLECGALVLAGRHQWHAVKRWDGVRLYPTQEMLIRTLLNDYAVRTIGPSINQPGDPIPRYVYHCRIKKPTALLLSGPSGVGKSATASLFASRGFPVYDLDTFFLRLVSDDRMLGLSFVDLIRKEPFCNTRNVSELLVWLKRNPHHIKEAVSLVIKELPPVSDLFIIEGAALNLELFYKELSERLFGEGISSWHASPHLPFDQVDELK
jgi:SAM-dependent methyltransferase